VRRLKRLYPWLRVVFADRVYDRLASLLACFLLGLTLIVIRCLAGTEGFVVVPRRWAAESRGGVLDNQLAFELGEYPEDTEDLLARRCARVGDSSLAGYPQAEMTSNR
jgi:putative transposase